MDEALMVKTQSGDRKYLPYVDVIVASTMDNCWEKNRTTKYLTHN